MTISFSSIPGGRRVPGAYVEFDASKAVSGLPAAQQKILLIGQRLAAGSIGELVKQRISSVAQGIAYFGRGSMLAGMIAALIAANPETELWAIAADDDAEGTAAQKTITITGTATAAGTLALMVEGVQVPVAVASGNTATAIATATAAAINALADLMLSAASSGGVVTLTSRHKGTTGNDLDVRTNHYQGSLTPAGITVAIAATTTGAANPDITAVFAALGDDHFPTIAIGWTDSATMNAVDSELASRWGPMRQIEGRAYFGTTGSFSTLSATGAARNGPHATLVGMTKLPSPPHKLAAAVAGVAAFHLQIDPARPLTTLLVPGIVAPLAIDLATRQERELLLKDGISTFTVDVGGNVLIERLISTYQTNGFGLDDIAYLDVTTTATLAYYRQSMRALIAAKYPRHKLAGDDARFGAGQAVVTPKVIRAELIALARQWEDAGLMEDVDGFIARLVVERDDDNPSQLNVLTGPDVVNGFLQFAARIEFRL